MTTPHEANIINADRVRHATLMREHLEKHGVTVSVMRSTGVNFSPTTYSISHGDLHAVGSTFDLALLNFIERLLKERVLEPTTAYRAMEAALQLVAGNVVNMRTELLVIKAEIMKDEHSHD